MFAVKNVNDCGDLELQNGIVNVISNISIPITKAILLCDNGYVLVGDHTRYCNMDGGTWTGSDGTCSKCHSKVQGRDWDYKYDNKSLT